jgi:hypothetical protein
MAHEIPYWDYIFLAEDDCGSDGFKVEHGGHFWADTNGNDQLLTLTALLPQCVWLELYGDPEGMCFSPWLRVCFRLYIRPANDILRLCSILTRSLGLRRHSTHVSMPPETPEARECGAR